MSSGELEKMEQPRITTLWNVFSTSSEISLSSTLFTSDRWITSSQQMLLSSFVSFLNPLLQAASEDIPIVRRPDRKDLLGYLKVFLRLKPNFCHSGHVHCSGRSCLCSFHWSLGSFGDANPGTFSSLKITLVSTKIDQGETRSRGQRRISAKADERWYSGSSED